MAAILVREVTRDSPQPCVMMMVGPAGSVPWMSHTGSSTPRHVKRHASNRSGEAISEGSEGRFRASAQAYPRFGG